ncbi:uncharacterized protein MELLADRAFT_101005 [Melampsora larici-populina 98AG31]|uniref:Uncharacterized protein n=1 Tax=Melampsora larici-populina (strain 98AG31 / pathotype 3-4-7) TaxID=747676 RepID=F4R3A9_MELLP|nr:uncharacterized protein MELLADRAFT_101005 [Melampsora larici-populina 98AG31]EGG13202.1 hypothetical protein MELLADRAFT_101005 [Melampsora larici-populina 98AG31]
MEQVESRRRRMESRAPGGTQSTSMNPTQTEQGERIEGGVVEGGGKESQVVDEENGKGEEVREGSGDQSESEELMKEDIQREIQKKNGGKKKGGVKGKEKKETSSSGSESDEGWLRKVKDYGMLVEKDNRPTEERSNNKKEKRGKPDGRPLLDRNGGEEKGRGGGCERWRREEERRKDGEGEERRKVEVIEEEEVRKGEE